MLCLWLKFLAFRAVVMVCWPNPDNKFLAVIPKKPKFRRQIFVLVPELKHVASCTTARGEQTEMHTHATSHHTPESQERKGPVKHSMIQSVMQG
jgi:hypothetical protein